LALQTRRFLRLNWSLQPAWPVELSRRRASKFLFPRGIILDRDLSNVVEATFHSWRGGG
jgi:hypothetical protein